MGATCGSTSPEGVFRTPTGPIARSRVPLSRFRLRPFRNGDPPALADLWNRGTPQTGVARPLASHEFDAAVVNKLGFDRQGLLVAEPAEGGRPVGFVHAGFGPADPAGPSHQPDLALGAVAMLVIEPTLRDPAELGRELLDRALVYLRSRGASVLYAGGQAPLNPFYWGVYGGSEWAGILDDHSVFREAVEAGGFRPVSTTQLLELDLAHWRDPRDPKSAFLRRQSRLEVEEDVPLPRWWDALAIGQRQPTVFRLASKSEGRSLALALTWDMDWFGRDGRSRLGIALFEVFPDSRRKGLGRHLLIEILRHAQSQLVEVLAVQTPTTNTPALALYRSAGFEPAGTSTLYRLPGLDDPAP